MFQKAAANQRTTVARNFFPPQSQTRAPPSPEQHPTPLLTTSKNALRSQPVAVHQNASLKRSASGLARALSSQGGFEDPMYPELSNTYTSQQKQPATQAGIFFENEYFDEDDFGSDFELDMEDPKEKSTVTYPDLSTLMPEPRSPRIAGNPMSTPPIPWSSSPVDHRTRTSNLSRFVLREEMTTAQTVNGTDLPPHPKKRRTIPWLEDQRKEKMLLSELPSSSARVPKSTYPWNISASVVSQKRDQLRLNKSVKTNQATRETKAEVAAKRREEIVPKLFLTEEQKHVQKLVVEDQKSIFFTGSAGTGKSVLLREIIMKLCKKYSKEPDRVAVTASTGLAACNIGGVTLHSFAGIGLGKGPVEELVKKIRRNQKARHRWMRTKILVIDEVSMVDGELYDKLEAIARRIRNNGRPFGGIQLVITGDFFQLPPVPDGGRQAQFAFNADSWNTTIEHTICLQKVFRQKDPEFARMLNQMREGRLDAQSINKFRSLNRPLSFEDQLDGTELYVQLSRPLKLHANISQVSNSCRGRKCE
jgi:ATP-dependent DNA helicase PIF1